MWKYGGDKIERRLSEIIKKIWRGEGYPKDWEEGVVISIWKRGDRKVVDNYRE